MTDAPDIVKRLVETFRENIDSYRSSSYNEAQVRIEFIDPMFKALGWDMDNEAGYAEAFKDVIHEAAIKVGGATKAPDYCFRIGGTRKFFLEAKKPAVSIRNAPEPAYQLRRYAWSAKLPLSILTDFEEFAVYDCRTRPLPNDKSSMGRTLYLKYTDYLDHWDEIAGIFSKEAILKGSFDKYAVSTRRKRGTAEVDASFLAEIESWRDVLARNIALRNKGLGVRELNHAVQRTVDRMIFLRICEDRGIENYGRLQALLNGPHTYERLAELFHRADERYNSGLFHFQREKGREDHDGWTLDLVIDDKVLKEIIKRLYYPDCPFEFSVLPADILGQIYEQFLGKVIRLTKGHQAKVEFKPEVRKAGGVYYTPTYLVDYIVKNTVGKLCQKSTPAKVAKMRILDPACGSGSFLLGAYQFLLDWHLKWYIDNDPEKHARGKKPAVYQAAHNDWRLTTARRKEILLNNVFGVDIDTQAVEVTKLSLLLKVLEGQTAEGIKQQLALFHQRALPDLSSNIKCGNSLIGPDFYEGKQMSMFDQEEVYRINAFDWNNEFPDIMQRGGFDAVIGNPPYVRQETLGHHFKDYVKRHFQSFAGTADIYVYFIEQSHRVLKSRAYFGMICSNKFMRASYGKALRDYLATRTTLRQIVDFGELPVFQKAATFPAIFLTQNVEASEQEFIYAPIKRLLFSSLGEEVRRLGMNLDKRSLSGQNWTLARGEEIAVFEKMGLKAVALNEYIHGKIFMGIKTGLNKAFVIDRETRHRLISEDPKSADIIRPFVLGDDVRRYHIAPRERYLLFIPNQWTRERGRDASDLKKWFRENYPAVFRHLEPFELAAKKRCDKGEHWWELRACSYYAEFAEPKIIYPDISKGRRLTIDRDGLLSGNTTYFLSTDDVYLLGVLNSRLIFSYFKRVAAVLGDADKAGRMRWFSQDVGKLPIRRIDFDDPADKARHDRMVELVERMLDLHKRLSEVRTEHDKEVLRRQIALTDAEIDRLVYELYGLTDEEIKIVEGKG